MTGEHAPSGADLEAILSAWLDAGSHPRYHDEVLRRIRESAPILGASIDRAARAWQAAGRPRLAVVRMSVR